MLIARSIRRGCAACLLRFLRKLAGSQILVMSSGAAIYGSPLSGGYAGAKATLRFLAAYANEESHRAGLGITVTAVLPRLTPQTELGRAAVAAYAARAGASQDQFVARLGRPVTPQIAGDAFVTIATAGGEGGAYELTGDVDERDRAGNQFHGSLSLTLRTRGRPDYTRNPRARW